MKNKINKLLDDAYSLLMNEDVAPTEKKPEIKLKRRDDIYQSSSKPNTTSKPSDSSKPSARRISMRADGKTIVEIFSDDEQDEAGVKVTDLDGKDAGEIIVIRRPYKDFKAGEVDYALKELRKDENDPLGIVPFLNGRPEPKPEEKHFFVYDPEQELLSKVGESGVIFEKRMTQKQYDRWAAENLKKK